jgi:hypothetical protein
MKAIGTVIGTTSTGYYQVKLELNGENIGIYNATKVCFTASALYNYELQDQFCHLDNPKRGETKI